MSPDPRRSVPRTDRVLADERLRAAEDRLGRSVVRQAVRRAQQQVRDGQIDPDAVVDRALAALPASAFSGHPVINATGVVLHTNLGRAALSPAARQAIAAASGFTDVEYDLASGRRAGRGRGALDALREAVPAAESVAVVNNGAAALVLATTALAGGGPASADHGGADRREVVISRGEMVEIGDNFRLPELITSTGARLREVGTTNRTATRDYEEAIGARTGCLLKVHPSNFRIDGFTSSVGVAELSRLADRAGVPLLVDIGSGLLGPDPLLPDEPDADTALRAGADVVTASGDKLLGGPQAGLLLGRTGIIERLRRHPLARALRVDKLTLAALEATLRGPLTPTWSALRADPALLQARAEAIVSRLAGPEGDLNAEVVGSDGVVGGGGAPGLTLPGWAIAVPAELAAPLRRGDPAVVGRLEHGRCLLDLRCVPPEADEAVLAALQAAGSS